MNKEIIQEKNGKPKITIAILVGFIIPYFYLKNRRIVSLKKRKTK